MDEDGPRFIQEPPALLEFTNQTGATVWCAATGHPQPTVVWISASELATTTTAGTTLLMEMAGLRRMTGGTSQNISLVFPPFAASSYRPDVHSTAYRCRATSPSGTILSREMRLRAVQSYEIQASGGSAMKGGVAVLRCSIPPAIKNDIIVTSWIQEFTGLTIYPSLQGGN
uniref:Ig-like domain-containing protein n=1 Tax=Daphnia galeata TaxID=27404 RepID=A0A8J2VZC2_9CRUS|nr:unnamed protein product [Daphnia galeata]